MSAVRSATTPSAASPVAGTADGDAVQRGRRVLQIERDAIEEASRRLGDEFARAVAMMSRTTGRILVSGVGKSGHVGRKIAATLTSTGSPAAFLEPVEALHGDLGIVGSSDIALLLSKSGETEEVLALLEQLVRLGVRTIALTGGPGSTLARHADVSLDASVREEACPHDLAPTTSTTVALALGDALAVALLEEKGFRREDFARLHPGGALGRRLLLRVGDVMVHDPLPVLPLEATMREAIVVLAERRGLVVIVDSAGGVAGVLTAGDLTRLMERTDDVFGVHVQAVMNASPKWIGPDELASSAVYRMEQYGIMAMPVIRETDRSLAGVVHLHDLMRAGVA